MKAAKNVADLRVQTEPDDSRPSRSPGGTSSRSRYLPRMSPNLTPKSHLQKLLQGPIPLTTRSSKPNFPQDKSFEYSKTERGSKSPNFGHNTKDVDRSTEDRSEDFGKKLLDVAQERKYLEEQYRLMENRVKHLMDENNKVKSKIKQTQIQTKNIIKNREEFVHEEERARVLRETVEREAYDKKEKAIEMRKQNEKKRKEKQEQILQEKARLALEVKQQKIKDQELKEELKREEEIKKNERIWKIALHEKELENTKMYQRIKARDMAKKVYENKMEDQEKKAEEIERKIKELEQLESKLVDDLKQTHMSHVNVYSEMEKVYEAKPKRCTPPPSNKGTVTKSVSPYRVQNKK